MVNIALVCLIRIRIDGSLVFKSLTSQKDPGIEVTNNTVDLPISLLLEGYCGPGVLRELPSSDSFRIQIWLNQRLAKFSPRPATSNS